MPAQPETATAFRDQVAADARAILASDLAVIAHYRRFDDADAEGGGEALIIVSAPAATDQAAAPGRGGPAAGAPIAGGSTARRRIVSVIAFPLTSSETQIGTTGVGSGRGIVSLRKGDTLLVPGRIVGAETSEGTLIITADGVVSHGKWMAPASGG